jgi:hypothetical protein
VFLSQCLSPSRKWRRQVISDTFLSRSFYISGERNNDETLVSFWVKLRRKKEDQIRVESLFPPCPCRSCVLLLQRRCPACADLGRPFLGRTRD